MGRDTYQPWMNVVLHALALPEFKSGMCHKTIANVCHLSPSKARTATSTLKRFGYVVNLSEGSRNANYVITHKGREVLTVPSGTAVKVKANGTTQTIRIEEIEDRLYEVLQLVESFKAQK